jgi:hypothetical protein
MRKESHICSVALLVLLVVVMVLVFETRFALPESIPLPEDIRIIPPSSDTPKEIAVLSGKWKGSWWSEKNDRRGEVILIIEELDLTRQKAKVVYAWGALVDRMYSLKEGWVRKEGDLTIQDDKQVSLSFQWGNSSMRFFIRDGKLEGERRAPGGGGREGGLRWTITMKPIK